MSGYTYSLAIAGMAVVLCTVALLATPPTDRARVYSACCRTLCVLALGALALCSAAPEQLPQITQDLVRLAEALR